jgi:hypothetical protein
MTVNYPTGSGGMVVGDQMFLMLQGTGRGFNPGAALSWSAPSGWTEIGSRLVKPFSTVSQVIQLFAKVYESGSSVVVPAPTTGSGAFEMQATVVVYRGTGVPVIVGTPVDEVTTAPVSSFQPTAFNATRSSTVISLIHVLGPVTGTNLVYSTANGFTRRLLANTNQPVGAWGDRDVSSSGSVTMPVVSGASYDYMAKTFALDLEVQPPGSSGWSVGQIKY